MAPDTVLALLLACAGISCLIQGLGLWIQSRRRSKHISHKAIQAVTEEVLSQLEPMLEDAQSVADAFDEQMGEKRLIVSDINKTLDKRIASLTLLLNRADAIMARKKESAPDPVAGQKVVDARQKIIHLASKGVGVDEIADRLSMPKGEVALIVNLHTSRQNRAHS